MSAYLYKGYKISNLGYHQPDHCVYWEAVDKDGCACFHGNTLREVEMLINDSEWEDKIKAKDSEIARLTNIINTKCYKCGDCDKFGSNCSAGDVDGNEDCRACKKFVSKEVSALRKLVNELADELSKFHAWEETRALVERAREMTK